jgi:hypothetical protein
MSYAHVKALKEKLAEVSQFAGKVFTTEAPHGTAAPYVVVHPTPGTNTQERVTGPRVSKHPSFTLHIVGKSGDAVQILADEVEELLFPNGRGIRIDVPGERGKPLWFAQPIPIQARDDPQPTIVYAVIETGWQSDPV